MKTVIKEIKDTFITSPTVAFIIVTLGAVYLLYTDLSTFIHEQQKILTQQVQQQQATTDLLNQISQRIAEIELKLFECNHKDKTNSNGN
jgi:hypothetical protein